MASAVFHPNHFHDGWIGDWSPGIGDPSIIGWLTVLAYAVGCWLCFRVLSGRVRLASGEAVLWRVLTVFLLALGINKQLDLQTALTEGARLLLRSEGLYEKRRLLQVAFILVLAVVTLFACLVLLSWARRHRLPWQAKQAAVGATLLLGFVLFRAASFHYVDLFLGASFLGLRANWVLELGGIAVITSAAWWRLTRSPAQQRAV